MGKKFGVLFAAICAGSVAGCGWSDLTGRPTNPVVLDFVKDRELPSHYNYQTISTDASRRTIFVRFWKVGPAGTLDGGSAAAGGEPANRGRVPADFVCAEPSPDALQAVANAVVAAARRGGTSGEVASTLATSVAPMLYRSQGLQLFRDQMFGLCLMAMNGYLDPNQYQTFLTKFAEIAGKLVEVEKGALEKAAARSPFMVSVNPADARTLAEASRQQSGAASDASTTAPQASAAGGRPAPKPPTGSPRR